MIENDIDPADVKRAAKLAKVQSHENSFKAIALEWFEKEKPHWSSHHVDRVGRMLNKELFPHIGQREYRNYKPPICP